MKKSVQSYKDLLAWQKAMKLVTEIYSVTRTFPPEELFGLTSQLRRAVVGIPSNIAEGRGKSSRGEFRLFLGHAQGSLAETETQILIARNLGYIDTLQVDSLLEMVAETGRLIHGLTAALRKNPKTA